MIVLLRKQLFFIEKKSIKGHHAYSINAANWFPYFIMPFIIYYYTQAQKL